MNSERPERLSTEIHDYLNPAYKWCVVRLDGVEIGICDVRPDGYVLRGARKVHSLDDIARLMLRGTIKAARKEAIMAAAAQQHALEQLRSLKAAGRENGQCR